MGGCVLIEEWLCSHTVGEGERGCVLFAFPYSTQIREQQGGVC